MAGMMQYSRPPGSPDTLERSTTMLRHILRFWQDESGEDLIEYGLLAAFVATLATAVIVADPLGIKTALITAYTKIKTALAGA